MYNGLSRLVDGAVGLPEVGAERAFRVDGSEHAIYFEGVNVIVRSGAGSTEVVDGLGNIIIGYDEDDKDGDSDDKSGSHNLIIGPYHTYSSYGAIVAGSNNTSLAPYGSVLGGEGSVVAGEMGVVLGGRGHDISEEAISATVLGGVGAEAEQPVTIYQGGQ